jgi:hypothetical protein
MAVLRLGVNFVRLPEALLLTGSICVSVLFIAIPVIGFFRGASYPWSWKEALALFLVGTAIHVSLGNVAGFLRHPIYSAVALALAQTGLLLWCFGLGTWVASAMKDKNVLLPVAIFLALADIWLVFAPEGVAAQAINGTNPAIADALRKLAIQVPEPGGHARAMAYIGPADMVFLAMFFVVLFRFGMRTKATFQAIIPTLAAYLLVVLLWGDSSVGPFRLGGLPALVPIGIVVLIVNRREFKLSKDEKQATIGVLVLMTALVTWRLVVSHKAQAERSVPSPSVTVPESPTQEELRRLGPPA